MLIPGDLAQRFRTYWDEMDRCRTAGTYWALLHVTVCLPDICAALEATDGETTRARYIAWCDRYLPNPMLLSDERYRMRCKVLHQGRATTDKPGRYTGFAFGQPASDGSVDHERVDGATLHLDVGALADEVRSGVNRWIATVEAQPSNQVATKVGNNLTSLVRVSVVAIPVSGSTYPTTSLPTSGPSLSGGVPAISGLMPTIVKTK